MSQNYFFPHIYHLFFLISIFLFVKVYWLLEFLLVINLMEIVSIPIHLWSRRVIIPNARSSFHFLLALSAIIVNDHRVISSQCCKSKIRYCKEVRRYFRLFKLAINPTRPCVFLPSTTGYSVLSRLSLVLIFAIDPRLCMAAA